MPLRRSARAVLAVIALLVLGAAAALATPGGRGWLSTQIAAGGDRAQAAQKIELAHERYRLALRLDVRNAQARLALARLELARSRPEHAYLELQTLTELHPAHSEAWLELARLMLERGLLEEPEAALNQALEQHPEDRAARELRAAIRHRLGRHYGAWTDLRRIATPAQAAQLEAVAQQPAAIPALLATLLPRLAPSGAPLRGPPPDETRFDGGLPRERWPGQLAVLRQQLQAALQKQDLKAAEALAAQARRDYPHTVFGPWLDGIVQLAQQKREEAERSLHEALALAPRSRLVVTGLTKVWVQTQGAAYAAGHLMKMAEADPDFGFALHMAAVAYLKGRQPAQAEAVLRRGLELRPDSPAPYRELARYFLELDRAGEAQSLCEQGLALAPQDGALLALRARIADTDAALAAYRQHLAAVPDSQHSMAALARLLALRNEHDAQQQARLWLERLAVDAPRDAAVQDAAGWAALRTGQTARALEWLKVAAANAPAEPAIRYHLAAALAESGERKAAQAELQQALQSERPFDERLDAQRLARDLGTAR